jgi:drug/metabolite transporter (DMT)-like permease
VIQKIHQASEYDFELMPFLFFSLLFCAVFSFIAAFLTRGRTKPVKSASFSKGYLVFVLVFGGLCVGILNILNLRLAGNLPAVVQFPIYSIGTMILTGLAGKFIYKETIGTRKLIGFIIGCIAITVIAIF